MKKLAVLLMVCMLMLCAAAQAEYDYVIDLGNTDEWYFQENHFEFYGSGQILITGETEYPVIIHCEQGEITLRDVYIDSDNVGLQIDDHMLADLDSVYDPDTVVLNLEGDNVVQSSSAQAPAVYSELPLVFTGSGSLGASGTIGMIVNGDIIVESGDIAAVGPIAAILTNSGSLTVNGGRVRAYCTAAKETSDEIVCAYQSSGDDGWVCGKVNTGSGYVILAGSDPESAKLTDAYRGGAYLEITNQYEPALPETGDGANLATWTVLLAVSTLGVLAMSRRARREH